MCSISNLDWTFWDLSRSALRRGTFAEVPWRIFLLAHGFGMRHEGAQRCTRARNHVFDAFRWLILNDRPDIVRPFPERCHSAPFCLVVFMQKAGSTWRPD